MNREARTMVERAASELRQTSKELRCDSPTDARVAQHEAAIRYYESALTRRRRVYVPAVAQTVGLAAFGASGILLTPPQFNSTK
jgi:hypothetical protein